MEWLSPLVKGAEQLGDLSATAVWAFFSLCSIAYIAWDLRQKRHSSDQAWSARLEEAKADTLMVQAVDKLADEIKQLRFKVDSLGSK